MVSPMKSIDFYFDFGSPTAYLAATQLPRIAMQENVRLTYRPILLGAVFKATGNRSPVDVPPKARYMLRDLERFAARYQVPFQFSPFFPLNTLTLMRVATAQQTEPSFGAFVDHVYAQIWAERRNLGDPSVLAEVLASAGLTPPEALAKAEEQAIKDELRAATDAAVARGVFGVPTMFVGDEMFFGQDRLDFVREALRAP
jgi:2-hydroxychromene-2-carboxylate isomerase